MRKMRKRMKDKTKHLISPVEEIAGKISKKEGFQ